jgi:AAA+ ATPase superfamily predicted ATPase
MSKLNKPILTTDPHGEQSLRRCDNEDDSKIGNLLFELSANHDDSAIVMTGEELTSLANQWLEYVTTQGLLNIKLSGGTSA